MPAFEYVVRDREGRTRSGVREASDEGALLVDLRSSGLLALEVRARPAVHDARSAGRFSPRRLLRARPIDVEVGLQQIAYMLRSGLPLLRALRVCAAQSARPAMADVWLSVASRIESGESLTTAMAAHACFPRIVTTMVDVGERTGELDTVLRRSATALERRRTLKTNTLTALIYPAIVVVLTIAVVAYMVVYLVPKLSKFLTAFGRRLPPLTQVLADVSDFVQVWFVPGCIAIAASIAAVVIAWHTRGGRTFLDRVLLRVPLVGTILNLAVTTTFARNVGLMLKSGVRLTEALEVVEPVLRNHHVADKVAGVRARVLQGSSFSEPLAATGSFTPMLTHMVAVGESSGTLDEVLEHVADYHDTRLESLIKRLGTLIEPVIVVVLGVIVGFIYLAFFLAIYSIAGGRS